MSFGQNVAATKIELLKYKKSSQIADNGSANFR